MDQGRVWFKSRYGIAANQVGRDASLCASAILSPKLAALVTDEMKLRLAAKKVVELEHVERTISGQPREGAPSGKAGNASVIFLRRRDSRKSRANGPLIELARTFAILETGSLADAG